MHNFPSVQYSIQLPSNTSGPKQGKDISTAMPLWDKTYAK